MLLEFRCHITEDKYKPYLKQLQSESQIWSLILIQLYLLVVTMATLLAAQTVAMVSNTGMSVK